MKKTLSLILALIAVISAAGCGKKDAQNAEKTPIPTEDVVIWQGEPTPTEEALTEIPVPSDIPATAEPTQAQQQAPAQKPQAQKPTQKPQTQAPQAQTQKPQTQAPQTQVPVQTQKPTQTPTVQPTKKPEPKTLGNTLLADFKTKAGSGQSALTIADGLLKNSEIKFAGVSAEVAPGLLPGFGNAEITGFKSGATFAPMIGSIAFVGYVFELEDASNASSFIATLKKNANLRWNVCVEADEMITGSVGNKVFFVMCPKVLED